MSPWTNTTGWNIKIACREKGTSRQSFVCNCTMMYNHLSDSWHVIWKNDIEIPCLKDSNKKHKQPKIFVIKTHLIQAFCQRPKKAKMGFNPTNLSGFMDISDLLSKTHQRSHQIFNPSINKNHQNFGPGLCSFSWWSLSRTFSRTLCRAFPKFTKCRLACRLVAPNGVVLCQLWGPDFPVATGVSLTSWKHDLPQAIIAFRDMLWYDFEANHLTLMELKNSIHLIDSFLSPLPDGLCLWLQRAQTHLLALD